MSIVFAFKPQNQNCDAGTVESDGFVLNNPYNYKILFSGLIWSEIKQLWDVGLEEYVRDMWNIIDFITNSLYVATVALRIVSIYQVIRYFFIDYLVLEDSTCQNYLDVKYSS